MQRTEARASRQFPAVAPRHVGRALCAAAWLASGLSHPVAAQPPAADQELRGRVVGIESAGVLRLDSGARVRLQGVSLPAEPVRPASADAALCRWLRDRLLGRSVVVQLDVRDRFGGTGTVRLAERGASINAQLLRDGLALLSCRTARVAALAELSAAARAAQQARAGWFGSTPGRRDRALPELRGAVLGLHHQEPQRDYHRQLDELVGLGFEHVCLLFSMFVERVDSSEIIRTHKRTVTDARLIETIAYARRRGLSVMLLPILLILSPGADDWRGKLRPKDERAFWRSYDRMLAHYLDIAEHGGVEVFSIGSELGSLEDRTATWERILENARGRYRGFLTYSANWDHGHVGRFFGKLDVLGMTAYFSLTKKTDPTVDELVKEWQRVGVELRKIAARHRCKIVFTELGYASQDGINRDPWNYTMNKDRIDLREQADCFTAFLRVAPSFEFLAGAYFYDYYDAGGEKDWSYSPRGKPALELWRRWARGGR